MQKSDSFSFLYWFLPSDIFYTNKFFDLECVHIGPATHSRWHRSFRIYTCCWISAPVMCRRHRCCTRELVGWRTRLSEGVSNGFVQLLSRDAFHVFSSLAYSLADAPHILIYLYLFTVYACVCMHLHTHICINAAAACAWGRTVSARRYCTLEPPPPQIEKSPRPPPPPLIMQTYLFHQLWIFNFSSLLFYAAGIFMPHWPRI